MSEKREVKAPLGLRLFVWIGSALLAALLIWLMGFVLDDVGRFRPVNYREIEKQFISEEERAKERQLKNDLGQASRHIKAGEDRRKFLKDSVNTSQQTMDQMMDLQRMNIEKGLAVSVEQQDAVALSQKSFLDDQREYQKQIEANQQLRERQQTLEAEQLLLNERLKGKRDKAQKEYDRQRERRDIQAAFLKLLILLPVIVAAVWLLLKKRSGPFAPIVYAVSFAVLWQMIAIIHHHFPTRYYKYIFVILAILAVLKVLLTLIRASVRPAKEVLLKRYREAYRKGQCPICGYPIARGAGQVASATLGKKSLLLVQPESGEGKPYTCPSCGEGLFETCGECEGVRHSLLPNCRHCGAQKAEALFDA